MLTRYVASILIMIGIVEAATQCPDGYAPTLNGRQQTVHVEGGRITIDGPPMWDGCTLISQ